MSEEKTRDGKGQDYNRTSLNRCGVTMSASVEGNAIAELMGEKEGIEVTKYPAMILIDANNMMEFDMEEIAEYLGEVFLFQYREERPL